MPVDVPLNKLSFFEISLRRENTDQKVKQKVFPTKLIDTPVLTNARKRKKTAMVPASISVDKYCITQISQSVPFSPNQIQIPEVIKCNPLFTYDIASGNNGTLIIELLKARANWREVQEMQTFQRGNFYWRQLNLTFQDYTQFNARLRLDPTRSIMFNHMEKRISIANKHGLIKSLAAYYYQLEPARK